MLTLKINTILQQVKHKVILFSKSSNSTLYLFVWLPHEPCAPYNITCLIGSNNPSCPTATTQLRACLLKVTRYLWMKELLISHKSFFPWTQAINTLLPVPTVETKRNIAKLPASGLPRRNGVIPLIWLGASRSTAWNCFVWLQQGPLLTPASPLCVHPCKQTLRLLFHPWARRGVAARQQLMQLPDSQALGWQPPTRLRNTDA